MGEQIFRFKRFAVRQDRTAMKVGTDGVLLGAWCGSGERYGGLLSGQNIRRALDIGTGTGLIALMIAQRGEADGFPIDAIEIDLPSAMQARENVAASPWPGRIEVIAESIQSFAAHTARRYELIVANPPYFSRSLTPPDAARTAARHTAMLSPGELVRCTSTLLALGGRFSVIMPRENAGGFIEYAAESGLALSRRTDVHTTPASGPKRSMLEFVKASPYTQPDEARTSTSGKEKIKITGTPETSAVVIESDGRHGYSDEYISLTRDFYVKF